MLVRVLERAEHTVGEVIGHHRGAQEDSLQPLGVGQPLFFTNPASEVAREDITLKMSTDGGVAWSKVGLVQEGCAMYSSVVQFPDGSLGVQYDDAHEGPVSHAGKSNETFVRLLLERRNAVDV